jgi:hypothetical protein
MREGMDAKSVTIEGYKHTILEKNRPTSAVPASKNPTQKQIEAQYHNSSDYEQMPMYTNLGSVPNLSNTKKPRTANSAGYHRSKQ